MHQDKIYTDAIFGIDQSESGSFYRRLRYQNNPRKLPIPNFNNLLGTVHKIEEIRGTKVIISEN